jgi:TolA-binding protein
MADLAALLVKKDQLIDRIANLTAAVDNRQRALARAESDLKFTTDPARKGRLEAQISELQRDVAAFSGDLTGLNQQLAQVNNQIAQAQSQQGAQASAGQQVKQAQTARDDSASPTNPPPPARVADNGRVVPAQNRPASNAQKPKPGAVDSGTNAPVVAARNTQSTPPITARPGAARPSTSSPSPSPTPTQDRGTAAAGDDNPGATAVRARLNALFGQGIEAKPNILDQYASYTYNISVYLMSPAQYGALIRTKKKTVAGYQLLFMSGGAGPAGTKTAVPTLSRQEKDFVTDSDLLGQSLQSLGRNEFFSLDYYIDDVQVKSVLPLKGTNSAHNVTELKFKVIEPYGVTFLDNLFAATQQYIKVGGGDINKNYSAQNYLMVIRFYGYDDQGNLVTVGRTGQDAAGSDVNAIVEKFIPFQFTGIKFRIASKVVEYECSAVCPQNNVNTSSSRGVVPYNIELQSQTLKDLLTGTPKFAADNGEGRVTPTGADSAAGARDLTNTSSRTRGLGQIGDTPAA